jgi:protein gp37
MAENSKIEWTDHTFNPWIGCQKVSPGCDNCYAEALSKRYGWAEWGPHGERKRTSQANWKLPLRWAKAARGTGKRPRVFCASLADVWDNQVPVEWRRDLFHLIWETPELDWLLLTKRPENIADMLWPAIGEAELWPWPNVWLGTTAEDDERYQRRWNILARIPAKVRFISHEPALGPLGNLRAHPSGKFPDWIIMGGESGPRVRPTEREWIEDMRDACEVADIPFFFKQMTGKQPIPADFMVRRFPRCVSSAESTGTK